MRLAQLPQTAIPPCLPLMPDLQSVILLLQR
jgi:hypothetical protein